MSRPTPFDYAFAELARERFAEIRDEARATRADVTDRAQFAKLPSVQRVLADVIDPEIVQAHPEAADEYLTSVFVAYRFWEVGKHVVACERPRVSPSTQAPTEPPVVPHGACYLQLPERMVWAQVEPSAPHEPVDGVFVTSSRTGREYTILAALGIRADRDGFSQLVVRATEADFRTAANQVRTPVFDPVMPGGREAGLRSLTSVAELLYLVQLALVQMSD